MKDSKRSTSKLNNGDILNFANSLFMVCSGEGKETIEVLPLDKSETQFLRTKDLLFAENLGQTAAVIAAFYAARSVHLRLNRIKP